MKIKIHSLAALFVVAASAVLLWAVGTGRAVQWFVMGQQALKSAYSSAETKSRGGR